MASKPKAKVWNEKKGCFTEGTEDNDNQSGRRGPKGPNRKGNNNPRDGQNEGQNNRGGGRQRGNRNQQNRGNNRGQNQGRQDYTGQNVGHGQMSNQGNQRGYYQGPNQQGGQFTQPLIPNQQMGLLPDPQYPFYNCPPSNMQYPPMMPAGPMYQQRPMCQPGPRQPMYGGQPCIPRQPPPLMSVPSYPGDNFQNFDSRDHCRQSSDRGHGPRTRNDRGRGGHFPERGQRHMPQGNLERSSSSMSIDSVGSNRDDRQGPGPRNRNNRGRGGHNPERGRRHMPQGNLERSSSSMSIDSVGSHHDDRQGQGSRNRNNRGRGGHNQERGQRCMPRGNSECSSSSMSIDSVGSQHDDKHETRNRNYSGRGRGAHHSNRGCSSSVSGDRDQSEGHGQRDWSNRGRGGACNRSDVRNRRNNNSENGARPKQHRSDSKSQSDEHYENAEQGKSRFREKNRAEGEPNFRNFGRGGRRGRGNGRYFRGNRNSTANRKLSVSDNSDQWSVCTVSEESDGEGDKVKSHQYSGRRPPNMRGFKGNRGRMNFRGRGNIPLNQRGCFNNLLRRDIVEAHLGENKPDMQLLNRFLRSGSFRGRVPFRGFRGGRGRFFRGRWSGFVGNRRKVEEDDIASTVGNVESDDQISVTSEVSHADSSITDHVSESGFAEKKYEICLDDIYTVKLHTLRNRLMRYKRKMADMRKKHVDKDEMKKYQDNVDTIKNVIEEREASEKKEMEKKSVKTNKQEKKKEQKDEKQKNTEVFTSTSEESEVEIILKDVRTKLKKVRGVTIVKGHVSFKPKTKQKGKGKPAAKTPPEEFSKTDSEDDSEDTNKSKQVECEDIATDETGTEIKKKRPRNRNRKKKKLEKTEDQGIENTDKGNEEREKVLKDLLSKLDDISLRENNTEKHRKPSDGHVASKSQENSINSSLDSRSRGSSVNDPSADFETPKQEGNFSARAKDPTTKSTEKASKGNDSRNEPDVNNVFKFMVKTLDGKGTPEEIKRESGLFPIDCDEIRWFRKLKRRFTLIERNGTIEIVLVSSRDATYCLDYITNRSCSKGDCKRYHVCKNLLSGNCVYGDKCKFSHDFLDERNLVVSKRLGYSNVFSSDEICSILRVRYPHICHSWIGNGSCEEPFCIGLHLCPRYLLGQCLEGESCPLNHNKCSDHNKPIVDAYGMGNWVESIFKRMVFMIKQSPAEPKHEEHLVVVETRELEPEIPENPSFKWESHDLYSREPISQELEDSAAERAICDKYLSGRCRRHRCRFLHCQTLSPYLWQVKLFGSWISLKEIEEVERAYCSNMEFSDEIRLLHNEMQFSVVIVFRPEIRAIAVVIGTQDGGIHTEARRLSTMSYKEEEDNPDSFKTQWRWYWMDDRSQWILFDQDAMQHTLEVKFLAKQKEFNYSRENYRFKYILEFDTMTQRNIGTGKVRKISRQPVFVSLQNVQDKQYPKSLTAAHVVETSLPPSWVPWDLAHPFELVTVGENSPIYNQVAHSFFKTLDRGQIEIDSIFRMQNHKLWTLYINQEKSMLANLKRLGKQEHIDKRYLFHGTDSLDAVRGISINNFDARVSGKNATAYGDGAYFARDAKYSHAYTKGPERFMFMVTVLVGDYTVGNRSYRRPPNKPGSDHELYDSCVNDMNSPSIFIVFDKNQYYPEYLVQYHKVFEELPAEEIPVRTSAVRPSAIRSYGNVSGAVGGVSASTSQPAVAVPRRRARSPPPPQRTFYPDTSYSAGTTNTVFPSSDLSGHSSVRYVSDFATPAPKPAPQRARDPVPVFKRTPSPKKDTSCCIQ